MSIWASVEVHLRRNECHWASFHDAPMGYCRRGTSRFTCEGDRGTRARC